MQLRTPAEFGALIKARRKARKIGQAALAKAIGVSRQWVIAVEKNPSGAELGLVLRALNHLDLRIGTIEQKSPAAYLVQPNIDIDAIISANTARKP